MVNSDVNINLKTKGGASAKRMQKILQGAAKQYNKINEKTRSFNALARTTSTAMNRVNRNLEMLNQKYVAHKNALRLANQSLNRIVKAEGKHAEKMKEANKALNRIIKAESKFKQKMKDTNKMLDKQNKKLKDNKGKVDKSTKSKKKATKQEKAYANAISKANRAFNKQNKDTAKINKRQSIGVTGLAFGFVGAAAGSMADTVIDHVRRMTEESAELLSDLNRSILFNNKAWDEFGNLDFAQKNILKSQKLGLALDFKLPIEDVIDFTREVDKAIVGVENADEYYQAVAKFRHVEPGISGESIASDLVTIRKSSQRDVGDIANIMFAYGNASKLGFTQAAKAMAFGSDAMRSYNTDLETFAAIMIQATNIAPALAGSAGRAISTLGVDLLQQRDILEQKYNIRLFDEFPNGIQKTRDFKDVLLDVIKVINKFKIEGRERELADFMDELKLEKTARRLLTGFAAEGSGAMRKAIDEIGQSVGTGQLDKFVENQMQQPFEKYIVTLQNRLKNMKMSFGTAFFKGLNKLDDVLAKIPWEKINEVMSGFGEGLAEIVELVEPLIDEFNNFTKSLGGTKNAGKALAGVVGHLVIGLKMLAAVAPIVGVTLGLHYVGSMLTGIHATGTWIQTMKLAGARLLKFGLIAVAVGVVFGLLTRVLNKTGEEADKVNTIFGNFDFGDDASNKLAQFGADLATFAGGGAALGASFGGPFGAAIGAGIGAGVAIARNAIDAFKDWVLDSDISNKIDELLFDKSRAVRATTYWLEVANAADEGLEELRKKFAGVMDNVNIIELFTKKWNIDLGPIGRSLGSSLGLGLQASWNNFVDSIILHSYEAFAGLGHFMQFVLGGLKFDATDIEKAKKLSTKMMSGEITGDEYDTALRNLHHGNPAAADRLLDPKSTGGKFTFPWEKMEQTVSGGIDNSNAGGTILGDIQSDTNIIGQNTGILGGIGSDASGIKSDTSSLVSNGEKYNSEQLNKLNDLTERYIAAVDSNNIELANKIGNEIISFSVSNSDSLQTNTEAINNVGEKVSNGLFDASRLTGVSFETGINSLGDIITLPITQGLDITRAVLGEINTGQAEQSKTTQALIEAGYNVVTDGFGSTNQTLVSVNDKLGEFDSHVEAYLNEQNEVIKQSGAAVADAVVGNKRHPENTPYGGYGDGTGSGSDDKPYFSDKPGSRPPDYDDYENNIGDTTGTGGTGHTIDKHGKTLDYYQSKLDKAKEAAQGLNANPDYHQPKIDYWQKKVDTFAPVRGASSIKDGNAYTSNGNSYYKKLEQTKQRRAQQRLAEAKKLEDKLNVIRGYDDDELLEYAKKFMPSYRSMSSRQQKAIEQRGIGSAKREGSSDKLQAFYDKHASEIMPWVHHSATDAPTSITSIIESKIATYERQIKSRQSQAYSGRTGRMWAEGTMRLKEKVTELRNKLASFKSRNDYTEIENQFGALSKVHNVNNKLYTPLFNSVETLHRQIKDQGLFEIFRILSNAHNQGRLNINELANGGIVMKDTFARIGEAGPEAILPLKELPRMMNNNSGNKEINISVSPTINIDNSGGMSMNEEELARKIGEYITDEMNRKVFNVI